jgi:hypothetical protein
MVVDNDFDVVVVVVDVNDDDVVGYAVYVFAVRHADYY